MEYHLIAHWFRGSLRFSVIDDQDRQAFTVHGPFMSFFEDLTVRDANQEPVLTIKQVPWSWSSEYRLEREGNAVGSAWVDGWRWWGMCLQLAQSDGASWLAQGDFWRRRYDLSRDGCPSGVIEFPVFTWRYNARLQVPDDADPLPPIALCVVISLIHQQDAAAAG